MDRTLGGPNARPTRAGRYELLFPLGSGGMGAVYAGRLSGLAGFEKLAAVKVIHPHLMANPSFVDMFLDEARLAARIDHPHVVHIHEVGEDPNLLFMVMELVRGQNLLSLAERALVRGTPLPPSLCAAIGARVAAGLHAAHELTDPRGEPLDLVHRDVCPQNVLVSYDGEVKLIDFGVAFARERLAQTQVGKVKGKLRYMAPERLMSHPTDRRSDIYSLGVVLFEIVQPGGVRPDAGPASSDSALLALERGERIVGVPGALASVIAAATHRTPSRRFPTAAQLAQALDAAAGVLGGPSSPAELSATMRQLFAPEERALTARLAQAVSTFGPLPARADGATVTSLDAPAVDQRGTRSLRPPARERPRSSWLVAGLGVATLGALVGGGLALLRSTGPHEDVSAPNVPQEPGPAPSVVSEPRETALEPSPPPSTPETTGQESDELASAPEPSPAPRPPRRVRPARKPGKVSAGDKRPATDAELFDSPYEK